jgi:hypothetical protein
MLAGLDSSQVEHLSFPENIRLGLICLPEINKLAYFVIAPMVKKNSLLH